MGKTVVESVTVAIGISAGKTQYGGEGEQQEDALNEEEKREPHLFLFINITFFGAVVLAILLQ